MAAPILLLGLGVGAALALAKRASSSKPPPTTDAALIDPSERTHPAAETARLAIVNAMTVNSMTLYEMTARAIETQLRMPKTAANVRTWATMAKQGGHTIAGDEVGADDFGDDEVGAARRRVSKLYRAKLKARRARRKAAAASAGTAAPAAAASSSKPAAKKRRRRRRKVTPALAAAAAAPSVATVLAAATPAPQASSYGYGYGSAAPLVDWESDEEEEDEDDAGDDDAGDDDEVGASSRRSSGVRRLPDWLRFQATQSKLVGDPRHIEATALLMRRMGYVEHAEIHLRLAAHR